MSNDELKRIVGKMQKLKNLEYARKRVAQLERELRGEPEKPVEPVHVPEFLRSRTVHHRRDHLTAD